jgi:uncharacterized protein (DUF362 family)
VAAHFASTRGAGDEMNLRKHELIPSFLRPPSRVMIRKVARYEEDLFSVIYESLVEFALPIKDKTVLLKPNLVGHDPTGFMNTHPAVIAAARVSFLKLGAARVMIGDGPAMDRDTQAVVESVRLREFTGTLGRDFCDLNIDDVERVELKTRASRLKELFLPKTVLGVDFFVSMPKLKTHHWAGVTLGMKNLFGIVPGSCYGWPKNLLHWAGIGNSILDINAAARPDFVIVDGVLGMEGNGPIQGGPKVAGVLLFGDDVVAADATACRVMGLRPERVDYLAKAGTMLGHLEATKIRQLGEKVESVRIEFGTVKEFEYLRA